MQAQYTTASEVPFSSHSLSAYPDIAGDNISDSYNGNNAVVVLMLTELLQKHSECQKHSSKVAFYAYRMSKTHRDILYTQTHSHHGQTHSSQSGMFILLHFLKVRDDMV